MCEILINFCYRRVAGCVSTAVWWKPQLLGSGEVGGKPLPITRAQARHFVSSVECFSGSVVKETVWYIGFHFPSQWVIELEVHCYVVCFFLLCSLSVSDTGLETLDYQSVFWSQIPALSPTSILFPILVLQVPNNLSYKWQYSQIGNERGTLLEEFVLFGKKITNLLRSG